VGVGMKLMIKQKLIIFSALLILIPLSLSAISISVLVKSNIQQQSAQSIEKDARVAEQIYRNRELGIIQLVQNAGQTIAIQGLLELLPAPSRSTAPTEKITSEGAKRLNDLINTTVQTGNVDFIVVTDSEGNILAPQRAVVAEAELKIEGIKKNPLFQALQNSVAAKKIDALSSSIKEAPTMLKLYGGDELRQQAEVKGQGTITDGLVLEAAAPITSGGRLIGAVFGGLLVNNGREDQNKSIAEDIKTKLYPELRNVSGVSIAVGDIIVSTNLPIQQRGGIGKKLTAPLADKATMSLEVFNDEEYNTAYVPIKDINSQVIGRIGVQIKQSWFNGVLNTVQVTILVIVVICLGGAIGAAIYSAQKLTKPIIELKEASNNISLGKLDEAIIIKTEDEIGELADALERMRISLKQALDRLRSRRPGQ
jgi:HAMP domain-containing protein